MITLKKSIFLLIAMGFIFTSCNNDDNDDLKQSKKIDPLKFQGEIDNKVTLDPSKTYNLIGPIIVKDRGELIIPAGTIIKASGGTSAYIAVAQGGKIFVNGTKQKPVVMTSSKSKPKAGDWGGLVICGKAPTNRGGSNGETATAEVSDLTYGGSDKNDNSGSIKYLRLEYTGANYTPEKEFNGLSLFGVGNRTTLDYIQSYKGGDDGFEFFGGTVNSSHIVSIDSDDDSFDFADGWSGTAENIYIRGGLKAGIEGSNNEKNGDASPKTNAILKNITIVSPREEGHEGVFYIKEGGGNWNVSNVYTSGYKVGFHIKESDVYSNKNIKDKNIKIENIQFSNADDASFTKSQYKGTESFFKEGNNKGAGNGKDLPDWAKGWTKQ